METSNDQKRIEQVRIKTGERLSLSIIRYYIK